MSVDADSLFKKEPETFKPVPVSSPKSNALLFFVRCLFDMQLRTIATFLRSELQKVSNNIIDIGAGNSPWKDYLPVEVNYVGLDIENAVDFSMQKSSEIVYYQGGRFPFADNLFSNALCVEVLEHVPETEFFLGEIFRCLEPSGKLILTVPWSARRHHLPHDYYRFTPEALRRLLARTGFAHIEIEDRGDDYSVVFNKVLCMVVDLLFPRRKWALALTLPLVIMISPCFVLFFIVAHLSLLFCFGSKVDPLGYALTATKPDANRLAKAECNRLPPSEVVSE